ncbi:MAG: hypothetical protein Q8S01_11000 [Ignavibacteria bacterium]|nr:hypothetical protein [Ignavibacteria bacterium]
MNRLKKNGRNAYDQTLANGISVTVLRGNKICMVEPNGNISVISELGQTKFKVARQVYSLK